MLEMMIMLLFIMYIFHHVVHLSFDLGHRMPRPAVAIKTCLKTCFVQPRSKHIVFSSVQHRMFGVIVVPVSYDSLPCGTSEN